MKNRKKTSGFTLIELLVVMAMIGVLTSIAVSGVTRAKSNAMRMVCLSNLRQMGTAALAYHVDHHTFPPASSRNFDTQETYTWEQALWEQGTDVRIQQCPSFTGEANWQVDQFTGYNYNSSYVGGQSFIREGRELPFSKPSASLLRIREPSQCALFGDGEYESGANKFMRSPHAGNLDIDAGAALAGTQGFRHNGKTNVAFADGHVRSLEERFTSSSGFGTPVDGCGFLSEDNSLYDLD